jgi:H+/Cl- antiporter ClcA
MVEDVCRMLDLAGIDETEIRSEAPITAFVIVIEMTGDSNRALLLMAVSLIACGFSRLICPRPVYKTLAKSFRPSEPH